MNRTDRTTSLLALSRCSLSSARWILFLFMSRCNHGCHPPSSSESRSTYQHHAHQTLCTYFGNRWDAPINRSWSEWCFVVILVVAVHFHGEPQSRLWRFQMVTVVRAMRITGMVHQCASRRSRPVKMRKYLHATGMYNMKVYQLYMLGHCHKNT